MEIASAGASSALVTGAFVDRFELIAPVHRGASAQVWVARQRGLGGLERFVAVRVIHEPRVLDAHYREAVLQEIRLAAGVAHPNVASIVDFGEIGDAVWIASEWVDGVTLADLRADVEGKRQKIPAAILLRIVADACAGLHAAHLLRDRGGALLNVVHGDLSPRSLVIGANGVARVVDIGVAKAGARAAGAANPSWREDAAAHPQPPPAQRIDRHADVWAVGALLEQMLAHVVNGVSAGGRTEPMPTVPTIVRELIHRAMVADPVERFATAAEMQGAIEAAMVTLGIPTTGANVAAFAAEHGMDRVTARAQAIEEALAQLGPLSVRSAPPPAIIDSLPAMAHTVSPGALVPLPPFSPSRAMLDRREVTDAGFSPSIAPSDARFPGSIAPPARRVPRAALAAGAALTVAVCIAGVALLGARSGPSASPVAAQVAASPPPPPRPSCPASMVEIAGGHFYMGSDDDLDLEKPAHHVVVAPYCIDVFETTTEQYKACSDAGDCKRAATENKWPGITRSDLKTYDPLCNAREPMARGKHPINCIDWDMAAGYCHAHGLRLPTEAEWEFAARGPDGRKYPWGDEEPGPLELNACGAECIAWGKKNHVELEAMYPGDDGWATTAPVGSFPAGKSRYGVQDVVGNVWEWTSDWFAPYTDAAQTDPKGPKVGEERVIRGGAWNGAYASWVRPTFRYHNDPVTRSYGIGFRCARALTP